MKIYVGNLSPDTAQPQIRQTFEPYGTVAKVSLAVGKSDGTRKGFGFVDMPSDEQAKAAIRGLNGQDLDGYELKVSEARPGTYRPDASQRQDEL